MTTSSTSTTTTIAVIGGGPGAMFFCHALETQRKELIAKGQDVSGFPMVKCFERSEGPGGVWRSDRSHGDEKRPPSPNTVIEEAAVSTDDSLSQKDTEKENTQSKSNNNNTPNMYSGLWTNGSKECYEMYDYTFRDHFGDVRMPTFLPRKHVLDYLVARVTKNCPDFFERYFSFRTKVENVRYDDEINETESSSGDSSSDSGESTTKKPKLTNQKKFRVASLNLTTGVHSVECFDKCIWAGGVNGVPFIPKYTLDLFREGGFPGKIVHSSDTSTFKEDVEGKTVLMVGGGASAEDLALMAIKQGVKQIYCVCRSPSSEMNFVTRWPYDKVQVFGESAVLSVNGSEVTLAEVYYRTKRQTYIVESDSQTTLSNIDTVIFCTGYDVNLTMLDQQLQDPVGLIGAYWKNTRCSVPNDWVMNNNEFSQKVLGDKYKDIQPKNNKVCLDLRPVLPLSSQLYKFSFAIDNPNMMYLQEYGEIPMMSLEINAWMIAKVVTNQIPLPPKEEMEHDNLTMVGRCLQCPILRYEMDYKYQDAIDDVVDENEALGKYMEEYFDTHASEIEELRFRIKGEIMNQFQYPVSYLERDGQSFSDYKKAVDTVFQIDIQSRSTLDKLSYDTNETDGWRTFRDHPINETIKSYFTGIRSKGLPKPWVELEGDEKLW